MEPGFPGSFFSFLRAWMLVVKIEDAKRKILVPTCTCTHAADKDVMLPGLSFLHALLRATC